MNGLTAIAPTVVTLSSMHMIHQGKFVKGYHAGTVCGDGNFAYCIYGEFSIQELIYKYKKAGYKILNLKEFLKKEKNNEN